MICYFLQINASNFLNLMLLLYMLNDHRHRLCYYCFDCLDLPFEDLNHCYCLCLENLYCCYLHFVHILLPKDLDYFHYSLIF